MGHVHVMAHLHQNWCLYKVHSGNLDYWEGYYIARLVISAILPPVDLHWFFEISIRTEKKIQLQLKKKFQLVYTEIFFQWSLKFFFSYNLELNKNFSDHWKKNSVSL